MRVKIILSRTYPPRGHFIQWTLRDVANNDQTDVTFRVERSGGPDGPWDLVAEGLKNRYAILDELPRDGAHDGEANPLPNTSRFFQAVYYRVSVEGTTLVDVFEIGPAAQGRRNGIRRKLARDTRIGLERVVGHEAILLKARVWGLRCPQCFDKKTGVSTRSGCKVCWGTTFDGGFLNPVKVFVKFSGSGIERTTGKPKSDGSSMRLTTTDVPQVDKDDVLVLLQTNQRYRVMERDEVRIGLEPAHQTITVAELDRGHALYHLRVDPSSVLPLF